MILTCEKCHTRYLLASHMLGYEGRKVRCTHCGHEWYQEKAEEQDAATAGESDKADLADQDDHADSEIDDLDIAEIAAMTASTSSLEDHEGDDDDNPFKALLQKMNEEHEGETFGEDFEIGTALANEKESDETAEEVFSIPDRDEEDEQYPPVPDGILPEDEDESGQKDASQSGMNDKPPPKEKGPMDWGVVIGGVLVILVLTLSVVLFIVFHQPIVRALPATASLYNALGLEVSMPGEGLIFDSVSAVSRPDKNGRNRLHIEGNILNVAADIREIPKLGASLLRENGGVADIWVFEAEQKQIVPDGRVKFRTIYPQTAEDITEVNVHFVLR